MVDTTAVSWNRSPDSVVSTRESGVTWQGVADNGWQNEHTRGKMWRWNAGDGRDGQGTWEVLTPNNKWVAVGPNIEDWDGKLLTANGERVDPWKSSSSTGGGNGVNRSVIDAEIEGARRGLDWQLGQLQKNYETDEALLRKGQEQAENDYLSQTGVNNADWRTGENSALKGASDIARGGQSQLANIGASSGSMLNDLYNRALSQFSEDEMANNNSFGQKQKQNNDVIGQKRIQTELDIAKTWDKMMNDRQKAQNDFYNQQRQLLSYANDVAGMNAIPNPDDFERRADKVDTTYTGRPISDFYRNTKVGISNARADNRITGSTPTQVNTTPMTNSLYSQPSDNLYNNRTMENTNG